MTDILSQAVAAAPTTVPLSPAELREGFFFAVCLAVLVPAAAFFPVLCAAALRRRARGLRVLAVASGVVGITAAFLLVRAIPGVLPVTGLYYALAMAGVILYGLARRRAATRSPLAGPARRRAAGAVGAAAPSPADGPAARRTAPGDGGGNGSTNGNGSPDARRKPGHD